MARRLTMIALFLILLLSSAPVRGDDPVGDALDALGVRLPTLGGKQFWADQLVYGEWRVQRNTMTGHSRLLDDNNRRHASGSFAACRARLIEISRRRDLPTLRPRVVLVLHGLGRSRSSMQGVAAHLRENPDWTVMTVGYPTTQGSIKRHARVLGEVVDNLNGVEEINFVAHSLGNLVIRRWMFDVARRDEDETREWQIGRFVMIGPPNHQPQMARLLTPLDKDGLIVGEAARELGVGWTEVAATLATPKCAFGIIAGGTGGGGFNPLIAGDDDGIVGIESARLPGAADFRRVPVEHMFIMDNTRVQQFTRHFLETGFFETAATAQPIVDETSE